MAENFDFQVWSQLGIFFFPCRSILVTRSIVTNSHQILQTSPNSGLKIGLDGIVVVYSQSLYYCNLHEFPFNIDVLTLVQYFLFIK